MGVVGVAEAGAGDLVQVGCVVAVDDGVQLTPYVAYGVRQPLPLQTTEIGLIMIKPFTGVVWASAVPHQDNTAAETNIACAIERQRSLKFLMLLSPSVRYASVRARKKLPQILSVSVNQLTLGQHSDRYFAYSAGQGVE